jgi:two-component system sensor histidine kinase QseC
VNSLRLRLLLVVLTSIAIGWLGAAAFAYFSIVREVRTQCDARLSQMGTLVLNVAREEAGELQPFPTYLRAHWRIGPVAFQVWKADGALMERTSNAPMQPFAQGVTGYADAIAEGRDWRVLVLWDDAHAITVQVGEPYDVLNQVTRWMFWQNLKAMGISLFASLVLLWLGLRYGLSPLRAVAADVAARGDERLDPIPIPGVPAEVRPLTDAVNALLRRLEDTLARERRFTSDCAHEVRAPLAGIKLQVQIALTSPDESERRCVLQQVLQAVNSASHLVEQLLILSRCDPTAAGLPIAVLDLRYVARLVLADLAPAAADKDIEIALQGPETLVRGNAEALAILLRNLLENAIRYTPPGGKVTVGVQPGDEPALTVEDNGPGIPAAERERVFERFYRMPGAHVPGCGLGLSIVQRVAQVHHARVVLTEAEPGRGLRVEIRFPAP